MAATSSRSAYWRHRDTAVGAVAQLGERDVRNVEVRGSIPLGSTNHSSLISIDNPAPLWDAPV
jgi:hypothetical protein